MEKMNETAKTNGEANSNSVTNSSGQSQYRATRIWYEIVNSFYANMILRKHWRQFRTYQDCFAASDAVDWLFSYLKSSSNFKSHTSITRQQAIQLLQIFLKEKIIEDVRASNEKYIFKPFSDDDRLYKFNTSHRLYQSWTAAKPPTSSAAEESNNKQTNNISNDTSTSLVTESENSCLGSEFNEKEANITNKNESKNNLEFSTISSSTKQNMSVNSQNSTKQEKPILEIKLDRESRLRLEQENSKAAATLAHNRHKQENETWSKTVHDMLETVIRRAISNSVQTELQHHTSKKPRLNENSNKIHNLELNLDEILFEGQREMTKNRRTGSFINHNCNHINKHGVVTETDDDFPPWLVKAMTSLLKWRQERNEFPKFEDVYAEINNYFNDINGTLLTKEITRLLFQIMRLLLLPQYYVPNFVSETGEIMQEMESSVIHEKNTKIFENLMKSLSQHLNANQSFQSSEHILAPAYPDLLNQEVEEAHLLENAKLPVLPINSEESIYNPGCCEDCSLRHNILNNFINTSAIEFNEFVSSINDLGIRDQIELLKLADDYNEVFVESEKSIREESDEHYDEFDISGNLSSYKLKQVEEKFSRLKLASPFKSKKPHKPLNRSLTKTLADRKLHRNNSFRAAIGEIGSFLKTSTIPAAPSASQSADSIATIIEKAVDCEENDQKSVKELLKKFDQSKKFNTLNGTRSKRSSGDYQDFKKPNVIDHFQSFNESSAQITKSSSVNSIQTNSTLVSEIEDEKNVAYIKKRKLADTLTKSQISKLNTFSSLNSFGMTPSLPRNYSFDHQKQELNNISRLSMSSLKSYNDLCNIIIKSGNENTASLNNLTDDNLIEIKNKAGPRYKNRLSNLSINTLNSLIFSTMNQETIETEKKQNKKLLTTKLRLTSEIESETLCFMISAFRLCVLMLPPANKRKLHLLLRFLYKLRCDQNSARYLLDDRKTRTISTDVTSVEEYDDLHFIDSSVLQNCSNEQPSFSKKIEYNSYSMSLSSSEVHSKHQVTKPKVDIKELEKKSKAVEKFIIKSFFKSIISMSKRTDLLDADETEEEEEALGMKLIQILINHYPEVMRVPDELVQNVNINLTSIKASKSTTSIVSNNSKISLQQYDKQTAEISKQHLADLLNNILTDMSIRDEDKLQRLKKFKDMHPNIYEEKYSTIKKALNILGLNNSASFLVPNIDKTSKNYFLDDISNRRDSAYFKKRSHMAKLTDSAKKKSSASSTSFQMNQTIMPMIQTTSASSAQSSTSTLSKNSSSSIGLSKFLLSKLKKENYN